MKLKLPPEGWGRGRNGPIIAYTRPTDLTISNFTSQTDITKRYRDHIPAPKLTLPGHAESYNPPPEYLMTEEEVR